MEKLLTELAQLKEIIALIPSNVFWKDKEGRFLGCNNNVAKILNLDSPAAIIGKTNQELFGAELARQADAIDKQVMENNHEIATEETGLSIHGEEAVYFSRKIPLHDEQGEVSGILGIAIDITERKLFENELKFAKEQADVANQAKTDFLTNMGHDLRTPFTGILSINEYLAQIETDPIKKDLLNDAINSAKQLLKLINEILELCNIQTGAVLKQHSHFNIVELVSSLQELMKVEIERKNLELIISCSDKIPSRILGDKVRLHRIMLNLIGNAIKFTEKGRIELMIDIEESPENPQNLLISVKDTGIGMPEDKLKTIFDRFTRLSLSQQSKYPGMGIGLNIVHQFVQELGGSIEVSSKLGEGSTFLCKIPLTQ